MLMNCKSQVEAMRAVAFYVAAALDHEHADPDEAKKKEANAIVEFFTPIVKGWSTRVQPANAERPRRAKRRVNSGSPAPRDPATA